ncbi:MAG: hypothetical protein HBSAPP03_16890 [Phycisphaerae bacterium]|nr:MAG: hypothetical protein HBSAPP03_16890 [Phycisphaerae bacterium]
MPPMRPYAGLHVGIAGRVLAGGVAAAVVAVLLVAARLQADPRGHGTHTKLGMYPCGWVVAFDKPCPTCGMTTAFAHAADAHYLEAFHAQPMGAMLAIGAAGVFWGAAHVAATGSRLGRVGATMLGGRGLWTLAALTAAAWGYKVLTWPGASG